MADMFDTANKMFNKSVEVANDIFEKSVDVAGDLAGTATAAAGKGRIKAKLYDQELEYGKLMRELGGAVYDEIKDDPKYVEAHSELFAKIASSIERKEILEDELAEADANIAAKKDADDDADIVEAEVVDAPAGDADAEDAAETD